MWDGHLTVKDSRSGFGLLDGLARSMDHRSSCSASGGVWPLRVIFIPFLECLAWQRSRRGHVPFEALKVPADLLDSRGPLVPVHSSNSFTNCQSPCCRQTCGFTWPGRRGVTCHG